MPKATQVVHLSPSSKDVKAAVSVVYLSVLHLELMHSEMC